QSFRERFEGDPSRSRAYKDISRGVPSAGIEYYLPLFFEKTALLTDYLPPDTVIVTQGALAPAAERFWSDTFTRYTMMRSDSTNPPLPPHDLFLTADEFFGAIKAFSRVEIPAAGEQGPETRDSGLGPRDSGPETRDSMAITSDRSPASGPQSPVSDVQSP